MLAVNGGTVESAAVGRQWARGLAAAPAHVRQQQRQPVLADAVGAGHPLGSVTVEEPHARRDEPHLEYIGLQPGSHRLAAWTQSDCSVDRIGMQRGQDRAAAWAHQGRARGDAPHRAAAVGAQQIQDLLSHQHQRQPLRHTEGTEGCSLGARGHSLDGHTSAGGRSAEGSVHGWATGRAAECVSRGEASAERGRQHWRQSAGGGGR